MAREFDVNGITYSYNPLDTLTQLFACRKTGIFFTALEHGYPLLDVMYDIPQADLQPVIFAVMPFVTRKDGGTWAKIFNTDAKMFSYSDIRAFDSMKILMEVLTEYVPPFLADVRLWESAIRAAAIPTEQA
jgi:hypothetical protein